MKVQISLFVEEEFKKRLDQAASSLTLSTAAVVRLACIEYVNKVLETKTDDDTP